jgi:hypothetical protein
MSNDAALLALSDGQNRHTTARPAAQAKHPEKESRRREEAGKKQIAEFKKSHALNGAFLFWLL